jgi:hypothetical protein
MIKQDSVKRVIQELDGMRGLCKNLRDDIRLSFENNDFKADIEITEIIDNFELLRILIYVDHLKTPLLSIEIDLLANHEYMLKNVKLI